MTTHMTSWSKMSLQKKWKQTASTGGGSGTTSPRVRKMRQRGCTQSEARAHAHDHAANLVSLSNTAFLLRLGGKFSEFLDRNVQISSEC
jgi:hypothetical protein